MIKYCLVVYPRGPLSRWDVFLFPIRVRPVLYQHFFIFFFRSKKHFFIFIWGGEGRGEVLTSQKWRKNLRTQKKKNGAHTLYRSARHFLLIQLHVIVDRAIKVLAHAQAPLTAVGQASFIFASGTRSSLVEIISHG